MSVTGSQLWQLKTAAVVNRWVQIIYFTNLENTLKSQFRFENVWFVIEKSYSIEKQAEVDFVNIFPNFLKSAAMPGEF